MNRRIALAVAAIAVGAVAVWGVATATTPPARLTLWTTQLGTPQADTGAAVAVSSNGMTCLYGRTTGEFVDASGTDDTDVFLSCYDKLGSRKWVRQIGTAGSDVPSNSFAIANNGDVYVAGTTDGEFPNEFQEGGQDVFVAKFNKNGALRFVKQFGGSGDDQAWGLTRAPSGDLYLAINTSSNDFPSGSLSANQYVGETDSALVKLSRNADLKWARQFGSAQNDWAWGVSVSRKGEIYVAGTTFGDIDGAGSEVFHGADSTTGDGFVMRFDRDGRRLWTRQVGGAGSDQMYGVAADTLGSLYVAGFTDGALGTTGLLASAGGTDGVVMKMTREGVVQWVHQHGSAGDEREWSIVVDRRNRVYVAGYTTGALDGYANLGASDAYVLRLSTTGSPTSHRQFGTPGIDATETYGVSVGVSPWGNVVLVGTTTSAVWGHPNAGLIDAYLTVLPGF